MKNSVFFLTKNKRSGCNHNKPKRCDLYKITSDGTPIVSGTLVGENSSFHNFLLEVQTYTKAFLPKRYLYIY